MSIHMKLLITNCDEFYKTFQFLEGFTNDVNVVCSAAGMQIQVYNTSLTAIADVFFPRAYFHAYECGTDCVLGISVKLFLKVLKNAYKKDNVSLQISTKGDDIVLHIEQSSFQCTYTLKTVHIDQEQMQIPEMETFARYEVSTDILKKWKSHLYDKSPITFTPTAEGITMESRDDMNNTVRIVDAISPEEVKAGEKNWEDISLGWANCVYVFNLLAFGRPIYLKFFMETAPVETYIELDGGVKLKTYIAPRMNDSPKKRKLVDE